MIGWRPPKGVAWAPPPAPQPLPSPLLSPPPPSLAPDPLASLPDLPSPSSCSPAAPPTPSPLHAPPAPPPTEPGHGSRRRLSGRLGPGTRRWLGTAALTRGLTLEAGLSSSSPRKVGGDAPRREAAAIWCSSRPSPSSTADERAPRGGCEQTCQSSVGSQAWGSCN